MKSQRPQAKTLALLGTGSDVGKSVVVAALCRLYRNRQVSVAPFKAQNMSNNSYVTLDGGEMGRAQVVQAEACGLEPHTEIDDVLILPGSKNVRFDLQWLHDVGWGATIQQFASNGGHILGICGGYQMLGHHVHDPQGVEGDPGSTVGLKLLDVETILAHDKVLSRTQGKLIDGTRLDGYEIHMGKTHLGPDATPFVNITMRNNKPVQDTDGAIASTAPISGLYFHGLFDCPDFRHAFLESVSPGVAAQDSETAANFKQTQYDLLADHFQQHLDMTTLDRIIGI